jgi:hypothetical protein
MRIITCQFVDVMVEERVLGIYSFTLRFQLVCNLLQFINRCWFVLCRCGNVRHGNLLF